MSQLDILSAEQYKCLLNLNQKDKEEFFQELLKDKEIFIKQCKRFPLEIVWESKHGGPNFRCVFTGKTSIEFVINILKVVLEDDY